MTKFNRQRAFDKVTKHLLKQGNKAMQGDGCAYRTDEGLTCAIGCLIPKRAYSPLIEGNGVGVIAEPRGFLGLDPRQAPTVAACDRVAKALGMPAKEGPRRAEIGNFLRELQHIHDLDPPEAWPYRLADFALVNHLKLPACVARALKAAK